MPRSLVMIVALACYTAFFASFLYLIGFVGGFDALPTHVDKGMEASPAMAVVVNLFLIALFGIQHSVMARPGFKRGWTQIVHPALERSLYVLATVVALVALFEFWHPIAGSVWSVQNPAARTAIWAVFGIGWAIVFISTFLINHFELFGLQQAWHHLRKSDPAPPKMRTPLFYRFVRHPIYTGFFIAFWAAPDMSVGHLLLALGFTIYIVIGIAYEERDLADLFGDQYRDYRARVGSFIPGVGKRPR